MVGVIRRLGLAAALLVVFAAPAAAAPTWLPATTLSIAPATGAPSNSIVASDAAGETFASWIRSDGSHVRTQIAYHAPGQAWAAATDLSEAGQNSGPPSLSLSSTGYGAIGYSLSSATNPPVEVSLRKPGGAFGLPTSISAPGVDGGNPVVAVDPAGDVVAVWVDKSDWVVHARRYTAASASWGTIATLATGSMLQVPIDPEVVISATGVATATWLYDSDAGPMTTQYNVQTRSTDATGAWQAVVSLSMLPNSSWTAGGPQLAVDATGIVTLVWFQYTVVSGSYTNGVVYVATRAAVGVWNAPQNLSDPGLTADSPQVATTPAGEVTVAWVEGGSESILVMTHGPSQPFPAAGVTTLIVPQNEPIDSGLNPDLTTFTTLRVATSPTGTVVTFGRSDGTDYRAEAVFRPAGATWPNPATTPPTLLSPPGTFIGNDTSVTIDGLGNAVASWTRNTFIQAAAFDFSGPAFSAIAVPASGTVGQPVAMSASALDTWSPLGTGQPNWSFGDGTLGSGAAVTHVFANAGTYTVTVGAADAVGNAAAPATRQIVIAGGTPPPLPATTVVKPKVKSVWKGSRLVGTVTLSGTVAVKTTLTVSLRLHGNKKASASSKFAVKAAGKWSRTLRLPSGLSPGHYDVFVSGTGVMGSQTSFTLVAPTWGIVKRTYASGPRKGPAVTALGRTSELWAHFTFKVLPKRGQTITTQWTLPNGHKLAANTRPRTSLVEAQVKDLSGAALPAGRWHCVIRAGKVVVATLNVRLK